MALRGPAFMADYASFKAVQRGRLAPVSAELILDAPALRAARDEVTTTVLKAGKGAISDAVRGIEKELEALTREAVPGRLWRAWASETYPKGGRLAREPVGTVYVNGGNRSQGALTFWTQPGRIRGRESQWLAIPTAAAGSRGRDRYLTPGEWERATGQQLRFVFRAGKPGLLVAEGTTNLRSGGYRPITRRRTAADEKRGFVRGVQTIVVFVLVPFVNFGNRVAVEPVVRRWGLRVDDDFAARVNAAQGA